MCAWQPDNRALDDQRVGSWLCVLSFRISLPFSDLYFLSYCIYME